MIIPEDNYLTFTLLAIISVASLFALADKKVFQALILHPASVIHKKEYYRVVTSALVHNNVPHLAINLLMLYVYCSGIEESDLEPSVLTLSVVVLNSLFAGHLLSLIINRHDIAYCSAGASGVAIGCMCSYLILNPFGNHFSLPFANNIPNIYSAAFYLVLMLFYSRKFSGGKIDYGVHFGGGIGGAATSVFFHPEVVFNII